MKAIELDQFTRFHFLSSLGISADKKDLFFVLSKIDMEDNGYKQKLVAYNIASGSFKDVTDFEKSMAYFTLKDGVYFIKNDPEKKGKRVSFQLSIRLKRTATRKLLRCRSVFPYSRISMMTTIWPAR